MEKVRYNLLQEHTTSPVVLSSTNGTEAFTGPVIDARFATKGRLYIDARGFQTDTAGVINVDFKLYQSYMGGTDGDWWTATTVPTVSTAVHGMIELTNVGSYLWLGYNVGTTIDNARVVLELDVERDIDSLGNY